MEWEEVVVKEVFFSGDEKGDDMLVRLFSGKSFSLGFRKGLC